MGSSLYFFINFSGYELYQKWLAFYIRKANLHLPKWNRNYWNDWQYILPKPISGYALIPISIIPPTSLKIPWLNFDWHPSLEPIA